MPRHSTIDMGGGLPRTEIKAALCPGLADKANHEAAELKIVRSDSPPSWRYRHLHIFDFALPNAAKLHKETCAWLIGA